MSPSFTPEEASAISRASNNGERVVHLYKNDCYFAHLSIYRFALDFCRYKKVFDAGCGTGYGSDYLVSHGATSVDAIDYSREAIDVCKQYFTKPGLTFTRMEATQVTGFPERHYDVIFSSNCLEHVPEVTTFFRTANRLLKEDGMLIIAVPPIVDEKTRQNDLSNPWHLNIWSPKQWSQTLRQYFQSVQPYRHLFTRDGITLDFLNFPEQCVITEADFSFVPCTLEEMKTLGTLTAIFLARKRRPLKDLPKEGSLATWVDNSFSRKPPRVGLFTKLAERVRKIVGSDFLISIDCRKGAER